MKVIKILLVIVVVLVVGVTVGLWGYLKFSGDEPHFAGTCEALELGESAEDMQIDRERGFAYLSLIDRMSLVKGEPAQGWIGRLDLTAAERSVEQALIDPPQHFRPHGVSLFVDAAGQRHLFVINHPENRGSEPESVESFREEQPGRFRHVRTYSDALFTSPNDLVAVGPMQFYVANDSNRGTTQLVYVDGDEVRAVADDIASGGGINVSLDGGTLYIAETSGKRIRVMRREPAMGDVETVETIDIGTSPDNIDVADDGSLWVGAHSNIVALVMHFIAGANAPTQILRTEFDAAGNATTEEIYLDR
ncbi:MAG: SMP-30/gluconolactonase/LRE family protein, partial [Gammaproteobacteria bacterium]|nr:SMP-30/gluconolactonase/LRE family protein [Gammaproteobacteria bacterium]